MGECQSCGAEVKQEGHNLCYKCWKEQNGSGNSKSTDTSSHLTATKIGEEFGISGQKMNLLLNELGWTYKPRHGKGWSRTKQGKRQGASPRTASSGAPYLIWPEKILTNRVLRRAVAAYKGESEPKKSKGEKKTDYDDFRKKYPANYRCMDGHYVRSRAEVMIDNWLYTNGIAHAYERKLPIEQDVYSDFFIKEGNVYIEFWGMESDEKYAARKKVKQKAYADNEFALIELNDNDLNNLDDILPRKLLRYGLRVS
jgi:hypothetical protein